jgi:hypothetical protein
MLDTYIRATSNTLLWSWECDLCEAGSEGYGDNPLDLVVGDLFIWAQLVDMMGLMHDMSYIRTTKCLPAEKDNPGIMNSFKKLNEDSCHQVADSSWKTRISILWAAAGTDHTSAHPYIEKQMDAKISMKQSIFVCWSVKTGGKNCK